MFFTVILSKNMEKLYENFIIDQLFIIQKNTKVMVISPSIFEIFPYFYYSPVYSFHWNVSVTWRVHIEKWIQSKYIKISLSLYEMYPALWYQDNQLLLLVLSLYDTQLEIIFRFYFPRTHKKKVTTKESGKSPHIRRVISFSSSILGRWKDRLRTTSSSLINTFADPFFGVNSCHCMWKSFNHNHYYCITND